MCIFILALAAIVMPLRAADPSLAGLWKTIDDRTHKARGLMRLYELGGAIFGKIETSFDPKDASEICDKCDGERRNKPVIGMVILRGMRQNSAAEYAGGDILDPDSGRIYRCKINVEDGGKRLVVRGFIGFSLIGRSQVWTREQ